MLALNAQQRRFVVGWIGSGGKNAARVARAAGYAEGSAKVKACINLRNPKVIAALREEAERRFDTIAVEAILGLGDLAKSEDEKVRASAIDSILDRTGYGRKTTQDIRVEHVDNRTTAELMAAARLMLPVIDTTAEPVDAAEG